MKYGKYQKYFWITLIFAFLVDISFDFLALKQSFVTDATGRAVVKNYEILKELIEVEPAKRDKITLQKEEFKLKQKIELDEDANRQAKVQLVWASILDLALLIMAAGVWLVYDRSRKKHEFLLMRTIVAGQKSNAELHEILLKKSQELSSTVHDLKNPLGSIKGFSDLIEEERHDPNSVAEMSHILQRISEHTLELVNSLVETESKKDKIEFTPRWMNLIACVEDVCFSLKPQLQKKQQTLKSLHENDFVEIQADAKKIWDVFMNLVGNAVKFSPKGSEITVRSFLVDGKARIEIEDQGPGFTEDDKKKAFGKFQRLSAQPTGDESSSGLGMSITKEIVEKHHGSIHIKDSIQGKGACIVVEFPIPLQQDIRVHL